MINFSSNSVVNFCELSEVSSSLLRFTLASECGSSSAVERLLAKEEVASSNLVFRSKVIQGGVAKRLRRGSATPLYSGSNPLAASSMPGWRNGRRGGLKIRFSQGSVGSNPSLGRYKKYKLQSGAIEASPKNQS